MARGKARKNEMTIENKDLKYKIKVKWTFTTDPASWAETTKDTFLYNGLTSRVRLFMKRQLDSQVGAVALYKKMMPGIEKQFGTGEQETINRVLEVMRQSGMFLQDKLQEEFYISEQSILSLIDVDEDDDDEKPEEEKTETSEEK